MSSPVGAHSITSPRMTPSSLPMSPNENLDFAGRMAEWHLKCDDMFPQLMDHLKITTQGPCVSGLSDLDYPALALSPGGFPILKQMAPVQRVSLPPELVEHFARMQSYCMMGLFPEIHRAWLSIDSDIYFWSYDNGSDLAFFDGLTEPILAVGLVKPKEGIFQPYIQFLLCLATVSDIVLLGISFTGSGSVFEEMHLVPEPLFTLPTDGITFVTVVGTESGRIFLGAKDGCLYEVAYQATEGWFSRKCRKINHSKSSLSFLVPTFVSTAFFEEDSLVQIAVDDTRHILYTRSEKGTIQVYDLGSDGLSLTAVASMNLNTVVQSAASIARTVDRSNFRPIINISVLESLDSTQLHLVAITSSGVRLYFTTVPLRPAADTPPSSRPTTLNLVHVRLPPGFAANAAPQRPQQVHAALYSKGSLLMASTGPADNDVLWSLTNALYPATPQLSESQATLLLDGKTWALAEDERKPGRRRFAIPPAPEAPLVVTQHRKLPRKFLFLTPQSCHIITQLRPVDILRQLLVDAGGADGEGVREFFSVLREDQACATALILACSQNIQDAAIADWAAQAFFLYGGEVKLGQPAYVGGYPVVASPTSPMAQAFPPSAELSYATFTSPTTAFNPSAISTPVRSYMETTAAPGVVPPANDFHSSGRHIGLYLYFGRIVRPLWLLPLTRDVSVGKSQLLDSIVTSEELVETVQLLTGLKNFIERYIPVTNAQLSAAVAGGLSDGLNQQKRLLQEAQMKERKSLIALKQLLEHAIEILGLWKVLCDHQLHLLAEAISSDLKARLKMMTFRDLILGGMEVPSLLVDALVHRYLDDDASTDAISARLREVCPSLYRSEDALCTKVNETLIKARSETNSADKNRLLRQALDMCKQIPTRLNLSAVCQHLMSSHCFTGVVDLCLAVASKKDPQNRALQFYQNNEPPEDAAGVEAFVARKECYRQICGTLEILLTISSGHPQAPSLPKSPGPRQEVRTTASTQLSPAEAQNLAEQTLQLILASGDELCHIAIFDWLLEKQWTDKLLDIQSPYLENYLKRQTAQQQQQSELLTKYDLLWRHYEKTRDYLAAAHVLSRLAEAHSNAVNLSQRVEYLARAIIFVKSAEMSLGNPVQSQFLHELEEKMDVARVQQQVLEAVRHLPAHSPNVQEAIGRLNCDLFDVTQLYENFAEPLGLPECKLAILHCAGHYDAALVENVWTQIFASETKKLKDLDNETKLAALSSKIKSLGRLYAHSEQFFPLDFIVKNLETFAIQAGNNPDWVPSCLLGVGIPIPRLFATYNRLLAARDPVWKTAGKPNHLLEVICRLLNRFADSPTLVAAADRRAFQGQCLSALASYLTELYGSGHPSSQGLIESFRNVKSKLERC